LTAHRRQAAATLLLGIAPLALLEGGLRLAGWPTDRVRSFGKLLDFDAQSFAAAIGVFRPGAHSTVMWPPELAYEVHINALGLRGPEISRTPPPGRTRILALGDSMTFGFYLGEGETWPARLEALLRAERRDVEVVNGGVGGWTISSETLFLEERALALAPAQVVVGFCANDIADLDLPAVVYERQKQAVAAGRGGIERALFTSADDGHTWIPLHDPARNPVIALAIDSGPPPVLTPLPVRQARPRRYRRGLQAQPRSGPSRR